MVSARPESLAYSGIRNSEIGCPAARRRSANVGTERPCFPPARRDRHLHHGVQWGAVAQKSQRRLRIRRDADRPVKPGAHVEIPGVLRVVQIDERRRQADEKDEGCRRNGDRAKAAVPEPRQAGSGQGGYGNQDDLAGPPADPDRLGRQRDGVEHHEADPERDHA